MKTIENIRERVAEVIRRKLDLVKKPELNERPSDCGADELDQVEIVMALEDEFGIEILDSNPMLENKDNEVISFCLKAVETIADEICKLIDANGEKVELRPEEQVEEKQADWYEESWDKLRESGLFRFLNMFLHIFGWAIQMNVGDDGKIEKVYPIRCKYDGFSEGDEKMMRKIGTFMKCDEWLRNNNERRFSENS